MKKNNIGFSLIEIIVGISISISLMIGVGVFVVDGMKIINSQKNLINQDKEIIRFMGDIQNLFLTGNTYYSLSNSGFFIKTNGKIGSINKYLGIKSFTGKCSDDPNNYKPDIELNKIVINEIFYDDIINEIGNIRSVAFENKIYSGSEVILGGEYFGDKLKEGSSGTESLLNTPLGITNSGNILFISDSYNDRILYLSGGNVYKLLDKNDNISKPSGIYYTGGYLFISNNGNKEALIYDFNEKTAIELNYNFNPKNDLSINKIKIQTGTTLLLSDLSNNYSTGNFIFNGITTNTGDTFVGGIYTFTGGLKELGGGTSYNIKIDKINLDQNENNYFKIEFLNGTTSLFSDYKNLYDNKGKLIYLTGGNLDRVYGSGNNVIFNNLIEKKYYVFSNSGVYINSGNLGDITIKKERETQYNIIVKDFLVSIDDNVITLKIDYYNNYDCFDNENNTIKTLLIKKVLTIK